MEDIRVYLADRQILTAREITKVHESFVVQQSLKSKGELVLAGEYVVMVGQRADATRPSLDQEACSDLFYRMTEIAGLSPELGTKLAAHAFSVTESAVRKAVKLQRIVVNRARESDS